MSDSPVDHLLDQVRAALHAGRADVLGRVEQLEQALLAYRNSAEQRVAQDFAIAHGLRRPAPAASTPRQAAERLLSLVRSLPELAGEAASEAEIAPQSAKSSSHAHDRDSAPASEGARGVDTTTNLSSTLPPVPGLLAALMARCRGRKLVVIGALAGRSKERLLPPELEACTEWVDTERDGVHAIGNLPQRIRQHRVGAVVILDRAVQHKHTEPILAAARDTNTPVAFAGKGGRASLLRAVEQLDQRLEP